MKYRLVEILACPECGEMLDVASARTSADPMPENFSGFSCKMRCARRKTENIPETAICRECFAESVEEGALHCPNCRKSYPIKEGIPYFAEESVKEATAALYGNIWSRSGKKIAVSHSSRNIAPLTHLDVLLATSRRFAENCRLVLDVGCGSGTGLRTFAERHPNAEGVGFDVSGLAGIAARRSRNRNRIHFVQGDALKPPVKDEIFDAAYSFGVLHHLPSPQEGFRQMISKTKRGGLVLVYVYKDFSDIPIKKLGIKIVSFARLLTSRLPIGVLRFLSRIFAPAIFACFTLPARFLYRFSATRAMSRHIPYAIFKNVAEIANSLQDRFGAPWEHRFSEEELLGWCKAEGLEDARVNNPIEAGYAGWVVSGFRPHKDKKRNSVIRNS